MLGLMHDKDYNFIVQKDRAEWAKLKPYEQALLEGMFTTGTVGESVSMSSLENHFYTNLPGIKSNIFSSLVTAGYYNRRPDVVRSAYIAAGGVVGFLTLFWGLKVAPSQG